MAPVSIASFLALTGGMKTCNQNIPLVVDILVRDYLRTSSAKLSLGGTVYILVYYKIGNFQLYGQLI